jgi:hypothetical protein
MAGEIYLGVLGAEIELPRAGLRFSRSTVEIKVEDRTANGTLVSDLRATKEHFEIGYDPACTGTTLDSILALYDLHAELNLIVTNEDASTDAYTVVLRPLAVSRALVRDIWLWSGVKLIIDEV